MNDQKLDFTNPAIIEAKKFIVKDSYIPKEIKNRITIKDGVIKFHLKPTESHTPPITAQNSKSQKKS